ncbi:sulfatase-modifying factor protein [Leptolyngbya sp. Heron Island J]|uniref:formylglycine-generating enzyme family protein n=1 Tax=Leptolyngbya sp. Heron Island J TaxID=1385935 RepID=UPI0003B9C648|nr:SUMF1/EgtB/PvdO family nonheme iron enzyme [Leptolyngbya sp. Heron Island J]ESA32368.1 sulfatase-modifying factor protein [Leptolyngbya sp. Heron Island J]
MTRTIWRNLSLLSLLLVSCQNVASEPEITPTDCEAMPGFAYVGRGEFIAGSDRTERDYAYRISAEGFADSPDEVAAAEAGYRQRGWFEREPEQRTENLPSFCMSQHLITNTDYQAFVQATGHRAPGISAADYQQQGFLVHSYNEVEPYLWQGEQYPTGQANHPVVLVSYGDAVAYADWRSGQDGVNYRLPTALEWEKAARETDGRYFPWGNDWQDDGTNWAKHGPYGTSEVGTYPLSRSSYGIEDMAGNVFEYTSTLVQGGSEVLLKGCSWDDFPGFCRAAYQHDRPIESRHILFGFRLVMTGG